MRRRLPRNFNLKERLERYAHAIEFEPAQLRDIWAEACCPLPFRNGLPFCDGRCPSCFDEVHLDLGCGKGDWLTGLAQAYPHILFVGMDFDPVCVTYAAQAIHEAGLNNAVAIYGAGHQVPQFFGEGELSCIYLNFPTPFPRKKDAHMRLVALERLLDYYDVLTADGLLWLRTDSQPLRDFTLGQLELAGYTITWSSEDERAMFPSLPTSYYEQRLTARGARVLSVAARPHVKPKQVSQTHSLSLIDYLPQDLNNLDYIPYGMEWTVETIRRRKPSKPALSKTGRKPSKPALPKTVQNTSHEPGTHRIDVAAPVEVTAHVDVTVRARTHTSARKQVQ